MKYDICIWDNVALVAVIGLGAASQTTPKMMFAVAMLVGLSNYIGFREGRRARGAPIDR